MEFVLSIEISATEPIAEYLYLLKFFTDARQSAKLYTDFLEQVFHQVTIHLQSMKLFEKYIYSTITYI